MQIWEARAVQEVEAAVHQKSLALRNSLPEFLDRIVLALNTTNDRSALRIHWDKQENTRIGQKHGRERAEAFRYTMDQLIFEYHILRQVICEVMEEEAPLSSIEREVIVCAVEQAVNDATTEFSDTLQDIQEKITDTLAHDLRGPITAAKLSAQFIMTNPQDVDRCAGAAARISLSMDRIDLMIFDLLDASRLRAGERLTLVFEDCDLHSILEKVTEETNFVQKRIRLKSVGETVGRWNASGVQRIVDNLVSNALKFSDPNSTITIELNRSASGVELSVHNVGNPISPEAIENLFRHFQRAPNAEGKIGWGLGLTVIKGLTEAHGGSVSVESSAKEGTLFKVFLPWNNSVQSKSVEASVIAAI